MVGTEDVFRAGRAHADIAGVPARCCRAHTAPVPRKSVQQAARRSLGVFGQFAFVQQCQCQCIEAPRPRPGFGIRDFVGVNRCKGQDQCGADTCHCGAGTPLGGDLTHQPVQPNRFGRDGGIALIPRLSAARPGRSLLRTPQHLIEPVVGKCCPPSDASNLPRPSSNRNSGHRFRRKQRPREP